MLAKHHHVDNLQKIEQVNIISMDILNETELITNPYEYNKGTERKYKHRNPQSLESHLRRLLRLVSLS